MHKGIIYVKFSIVNGKARGVYVHSFKELKFRNMRIIAYVIKILHLRR